MQSIPVSELVLIIYVIVDDWYQQHGQVLLQGKVGKKPTFSDCDVITLLLPQDYIPFPGENQFIGFVRANYLDLFPNMVDQSQFNRRARALRLLLVEMHRHWLGELGLVTDLDLLLDTKPVPVMGYKRSKKRSGFANRAGYGVCVSRNLMYFGYKLVTLSNFHGIPVVYELVAPNSDERLAAQSVLYAIRGCRVYGDKGFIGEDWQAKIFGQTGNRIYTAKRANQCNQNPADFDR